MRILFFLSFLCSFIFALTTQEAEHLLNRTSFGYSQTQITKFLSMSKEEAVDHLILQAKKQRTFKPPVDIKKLSIRPKNFKEFTKAERKKLRKERNNKMKELQTWWLTMMLEPEFAFREKMTLFWHNHFVSEYKVVKSPLFMYEQNQLYRQQALGNFDVFLHKSSKNLAMLIYLDSNSNKKSHPNENYARELLELFTLGEGHYSEEDIKEAARAFTGWRVNKKKLQFQVIKKHHDYGKKNFMSHTGNFNGDDIINIVLNKPQTGRFIVGKLYAEFVDVHINELLVNSIAQEFSQHYDISKAMRALLLSDDFWRSQKRLIKSPVEFTISVLKKLDITLKIKEYRFVLKSQKSLGQTLFLPPNVKGWIGHTAWIDTTSLLNRESYVKTVMKRRFKKQNNNRKIAYFSSANFQLK